MILNRRKVAVYSVLLLLASVALVVAVRSGEKGDAPRHQEPIAESHEPPTVSTPVGSSDRSDASGAPGEAVIALETVDRRSGERSTKTYSARALGEMLRRAKMGRAPNLALMRSLKAKMEQSGVAYLPEFERELFAGMAANSYNRQSDMLNLLALMRTDARVDLLDRYLRQVVKQPSLKNKRMLTNRVLHTLATAGTERATAALLTIIDEVADPAVRNPAISKLGYVQSADQALIDRLAAIGVSDPREGASRASLQALHQIGTEPALEAVRSVAEQANDAEIRTAAKRLAEKMEETIKTSAAEKSADADEAGG